MAPSSRLFALALLIGAAPAGATTITLSGSGAMSATYQFLGTPTGNSMTTANDYSLAVPGQYTYQDTFNAPQTQPLTGTSGTGSYAFQDTYQFTIGAPASGDVLTATLGLQGANGAIFDISGLQFRLFQITSGTAPTVGGLPSGATLVTSWTGLPANSNSVSVSFDGIAAGQYFLDVRGTADGSSGGTYIGQLNLSPVPLPAALPLFAAGLGALGFARRRRRD